ncbi:MAG: DUF3365 domain-containing protein [Pseudomonadota bacterium]
MNRLIVMTLLLAGASAGLADTADPRLAASRAAAQELGGALKSVLLSAMQAGGPVAAIGVCNTKAAQIAGAISTRRGIDVGRTALKVRNPANAPDSWERGVLERFAQEQASGVAVDKLEYAETVTTDNGSVYRYMKAIPTAEMCLACHGSNLAPALTERLAELYPQDQATGFAVGDIRGAFTISFPEQSDTIAAE